MIILPAIDLKGGECVRLVKGEFDTAHVVAQSAMETADFFMQCGARYIHMVDLDGALTSRSENREIIFDIAKNTKLRVETGGGIRDADIIEEYLSNDVDKVILGSAAINNPEFAKEALAEYKERIIIGIDAKDGMVCASGWTEKTDINYIDFAKLMCDYGCENIIFTDISKDGTLGGPNIRQLKMLSESVKCNITASGGIRDIKNIKVLMQMNLYGTICGKSIYSGTLDLREAIKITK